MESIESTETTPTPVVVHWTDEQSLRAAVARTSACRSQRSCLSQGTCLDQPLCTPVLSIGTNAGFVEASPSAASCGYCEPSFGGRVCFCPTRWAIEREGLPRERRRA